MNLKNNTGDDKNFIFLTYAHYNCTTIEKLRENQMEIWKSIKIAIVLKSLSC
jgi:hypothetical protein